MVEGQYYFNNQWFVNAALWRQQGLQRVSGPVLRLQWSTMAINNMEWGFFGDNAQTIQQVTATLWYRPIQAIKFGLQYSYARGHLLPVPEPRG